jgi:hypothetical protein
MASTGMTMDASKEITDAAGRGVQLIRRLVIINLGLVALQAISAGFFLSGYAGGLTVHAVVSVALQLGALLQASAAVLLWRQRRLPASIAGFSIFLFAIMLLQVGLGHTHQYWLHVPIGVGIFGGLTRQINKLDTLWRTTVARS